MALPDQLLLDSPDLSKVLKQLPRVGDVVETEDGTGVVMSVEVPFNGLYCQPPKTEILVRYETGKGNGLSSWSYRPSEIKESK
jgi:hypothetical protein